jgi:hypothetical protein
MLPDGTWVVCDFGSSTSRAQLYDTPAEIAAEEDVISKHTTPAYRPPEVRTRLGGGCMCQGACHGSSMGGLGHAHRAECAHAHALGQLCKYSRMQGGMRALLCEDQAGKGGGLCR